MDGGLTAGVRHENLKENSVKQETLHPLRAKIYTILSAIILAEDFTDYLAYPAMILEDMQLITFFITTKMADVYYVPPPLASIANTVLQYGSSTVSHYTVILSIVSAISLLPLLLIWAAASQTEGSKAFKAIIFFARCYCILVPKYFFMYITGAFLAVFACPTYSDSSSVLLRLTSCLNPVRATLVAISSCCLAIFLVTSTLSITTIYNSDPSKKLFLHKAHSRVDIFFMILKLCLLCATAFGADADYFSSTIVCILVSASMFVAHNNMYPYYGLWITRLRCGFYAGTFLVGIVSFFATIAWTAQGQRAPMSYAVIVVMALLYPVGVFAGWYLTNILYQRTQTFYKKKCEQMAESSYDNGQWTDDLNLFKHWAQVEFTARYAIDNLQGRKRPYSEDINNMRKIFERGLLEFPDVHHLTVLYALYTSSVFGKKPQSFQIVHQLELPRLFIDTQLQAYIHLQLELKDKELAFLDSDNALDPLLANEYARIIQDTKLNHYLSILYSRNLWRLVMERGYESSKLEKLSENMNRTVIKATEGYQKLIQKFPRSSALYRFYAHFSRYVLGDEEEADTVSEQARILEVARQEAIAASKKKGAQAAPPKPLVNPRPLLEMTMTTVRAKESNRIRTKLLARNAWDIKLLFIATTVIGLISFGILIVSHLIIGGMVTTTEKGIYDLAKIHDRNLKSTMALKRCRDMQAAYVANDYATFTSIQEKLFDEMRTLQAITRQLYASRDTSNALTQQLYTQPVINANYSVSIISTTPTVTAVSLYQFLLDYSNSGMALGEATFQSFASLTANDDFRFIADNWYSIHSGAFLQSTLSLIATQKSTTQTTANLVYGLTSAHIGAFIIFIIILDVYSVKRFRQKQTAMLNIFRQVPMGSKNEKIAAIEETIEEDPLGFESTINAVNLDEYHTVGMDSFRYQYIAYGISTVSLAFLFASLNISDLYTIGMSFSTVNVLGDINTSGLLSFTLANEVYQSDSKTWPSQSVLLNYVSDGYNEAVDAYSKLLYGDTIQYPPSPSIDKFAPAELDIETSRCLAINKTQCQNVVYNATIGYTQNLVTHGVLHVYDRFLWVLRPFAKAAAAGGYIQSSSRIQFLASLLEPYLLDGWETLIYKVEKTADESLSHSEVINTVIFVFEGLVIAWGQFWVFTRMIQHLKFLDKCNIELMVRFPKEIRTIPEVIEFINTAAQEAGNGRRSSEVISMKNAMKKKKPEFSDMDLDEEPGLEKKKKDKKFGSYNSSVHARSVADSRVMDTPMSPTFPDPKTRASLDSEDRPEPKKSAHLDVLDNVPGGYRSSARKNTSGGQVSDASAPSVSIDVDQSEASDQ